MKRGQQKRLPAPSDTRQYYHLVGAYNWRTDNVSALHVEQRTVIPSSRSWSICCCNAILINESCWSWTTLPTITVRPVRAALSLFEHRLRVIWLPVRCPDLNPIERYWRHLKDLACANKLYANLTVLAEAVENILTAQNEFDNDLRFAFSKDFQ